MTDSPGRHVVDWDLGQSGSIALAIVPYVPIALFGGYLGLAGLTVVALGPTLLERPTLLPFVVLFVLVGGPLSLLYLWPMLRDADQRPSIPAGHWLRRISPRRGLVALGVGALSLPALGLFVGPTVTTAFVIAVVFVGVPVLALFGSTGSIDPADGTLSVDRRTVDLTLLSGYRRVAIGPVELLWLRYTSATSWWGKLHLLAIPPADSPEIRGYLDRGVETSRQTATDDAEPKGRDRLAQLVLGGTGVVFLGVGGALVVIEPAAPLSAALVPVSLGLLFLVGGYMLP